jgi:site-specific recombinase XerD
MSTLMELITEFAAADHPSRTRESHEAYVYKCGCFARTLPPAAGVEAFTAATVRDYLRRFADTHRPRTTRSHRCALHAFGVFLTAVGLLADNPLDGVKTPRLDKPQRPVPTDADVTRLVDACGCIRDPARRALARAVVLTFVHGGLRRSELLNLCVGDIDLAAAAIYVRHGKGGHARVSYPHPDALDALAAYLLVRPDIGSNRVFVWRGQALGDDGLRTLLRDLFCMAGLPDSKCLPHGIRHNFACRLLNAGATVVDVSSALGHVSVQTTLVYLHAGAERLRSIAALSALPAASAESKQAADRGDVVPSTSDVPRSLRPCRLPSAVAVPPAPSATLQEEPARSAVPESRPTSPMEFIEAVARQRELRQKEKTR